MSKYQSIAREFIQDIDSGKLPLNTKLPSLRSLTNLHGISMTTALACYRYLEQQGYAIAQSQRGFYSQKPFGSATPRAFPQFECQVASKSKHIKRQVINGDTLGTAQLDSRLTDHSFLKKSFLSTVKSGVFNLNYDNPQGNLLLRQQLAEHFTQQGFTSHFDELIITNGCLDAVSMALEATTAPGDTVAVTSPCYSGLLDLLCMMDRNILEVPSTAEGVDLCQLEHALSQGRISACLLTANHQNPSGHCLSETQKVALAELAERFRIPIIEDDIFREVSHNNAIPLPVKHYDRNEWVIWCGSFSKTVAPGIRLGWCKGGRFNDKLLLLRRTRTLGVSLPVQQVMADYLAKGHYKRHLKFINRQLACHLCEYMTFLQIHMQHHCEVYRPSGGMVLWVKFPGIDGEKLAAALEKQNIYVKPGSHFSTTSLYREFIRINIGKQPDKATQGQLKTLCKYITTQKHLLQLDEY